MIARWRHSWLRLQPLLPKQRDPHMSLVFRPVAADDLANIVALVGNAGVGLTTLPPDAGELEKRIAASLATFAGTADPRDGLYLFVLQDTATKALVGIAGIVPAVGLRQAWYSYRVGQTVHASQELNVFSQTPTLFLSNDHTGHSELCSLFLDPAWRKDGNGALLSKARLLFLAQHRGRFADKIIAELRGVTDNNGTSPFWESLGRHFFSMDFAHADYLTGIGKKSFVAELMPKYPLYVSFLSKEAQAVIGETHELTRPAQAMLASEGFRYAGHVDIFDAGPVVEADVADLGAVKASRLLPVMLAQTPAKDAVPHLVSNTGYLDFRVTLCALTRGATECALTPASAEALGVKPGDTVRVVPLSTKDR